MSQLVNPTDGLLFSSILYRSDLYSEADMVNIFKERFGLGFRFYHDFCPMKEYYEGEMGQPLSRLWLVSDKHFDRECLIEHKLWAHEWEQSTSKSRDKRTLNCDVGLILPDQLILATGKPYSHRVYHSKGVFIELTYTCVDGSFQCLPWTYPDYANNGVVEFFNAIRAFLIYGK